MAGSLRVGVDRLASDMMTSFGPFRPVVPVVRSFGRKEDHHRSVLKQMSFGGLSPSRGPGAPDAHGPHTITERCWRAGPVVKGTLPGSTSSDSPHTTSSARAPARVTR